MTYYTIQLETSRPDIDEPLVDVVMDALAHAHPSIGRTPEGTIAVTVRLATDAGPLVAATGAAAALAGLTETSSGRATLAFPVTGVHVVDEDLFDDREAAAAEAAAAAAEPAPAPLSVDEAAAALRVSPQMVRKLLDAGRLTGAKQAGRWLVDPTSVARRRRRLSRTKPAPSNS